MNAACSSYSNLIYFVMLTAMDTPVLAEEADIASFHVQSYASSRPKTINNRTMRRSYLSLELRLLATFHDYMGHSSTKMPNRSFRKFKFRAAETDDNGNAMFQSYLSKLFKRYISAEDTLVPPWRKREK